MPVVRSIGYWTAAGATLVTFGCSGGNPASRNDAARGPFSEDPKCAHTLTAYPGDCRAPPPIDPAAGFVAHYGPRDYQDPTQISEYVLEPGQELVDCSYSKLGNADLYYARYDIYARPGVHHVILYTADPAIPDGAHDGCTLRAQGGALLGVLQGWLAGETFHYPSAGVAPENAGVARRIPAGQSVAFELHAVNPTDQPLLREGWVVFLGKPPSEVTETAGPITFSGGLGMQIPPYTQSIVSNSCTWSGPGQIGVLDLFAHMHAHGKRESVWIDRQGAGGVYTRTLVYESYDWSSPADVTFDSIAKNVAVSYGGGIAGGASGILNLAPGDRIDYECAIDNTTASTLMYSIHTYSGEMCNLFGTFAPSAATWTCNGN